MSKKKTKTNKSKLFLSARTSLQKNLEKKFGLLCHGSPRLSLRLLKIAQNYKTPNHIFKKYSIYITTTAGSNSNTF